jgi:hypothetical protein
MHQDARSMVNPRNSWFPRHFPPRHRGKAQIAALRHVVSSAELLCREDKTILMWPGLKNPMDDAETSGKTYGTNMNKPHGQPILV